MHQAAIALEVFADILEDLDVVSRADTGGVLVTVGRHPVLGATIVFQDIAPELLLFTEVPVRALSLSTCTSS